MEKEINTSNMKKITAGQTSEAKKTESSSEKTISYTNKNNIAIIRIAGMVNVKSNIANTLHRLRLRRKYSCVVIDSNNQSLMKMLEKVKYYVAYGEINKETYDKLIKARGKKNTHGKLKPFFRLHPPRGGIKSKLQYPKGVLGNNKADINKLIERML